MRKAAALLLALLLLTGCAAGEKNAASAPSPSSAEEAAAAALVPAPPAPEGARAVRMYVDGLLTAKAWQRDGGCFVPVGALCACVGREPRWSGNGEGFSLQIGGLGVEGVGGREYFIADGRYVWAPEGWLIRNGELYLPLEAAEKLFSVKAERAENGDLRFSSAGMRLFSGGEDYYELNFPADDLYWLSHIICAEARFEPLAGQIGVGNVVMNRVRDNAFPDTIFEVIYDTRDAIQFEPITLGSIREEPTEQAMIAACLVLEGADTVGDSLYFINPDFVKSGWFDAALEKTAEIGRHTFYSYRGE